MIAYSLNKIAEMENNLKKEEELAALRGDLSKLQKAVVRYSSLFAVPRFTFGVIS